MEFSCCQHRLGSGRSVCSFLGCPSTHPSSLRHGLVVRIAGSHPAGPGSIPGAGTSPFGIFFSFGPFLVYTAFLCFLLLQNSWQAT